jgi:hypothetical protein
MATQRSSVPSTCTSTKPARISIRPVSSVGGSRSFWMATPPLLWMAFTFSRLKDESAHVRILEQRLDKHHPGDGQAGVGRQVGVDSQTRLYPLGTAHALAYVLRHTQGQPSLAPSYSSGVP